MSILSGLLLQFLQWFRRVLALRFAIALPESDGPYATLPSGSQYEVLDDGVSLSVSRAGTAAAVVLVWADKNRSWREVSGAVLAAMDEHIESLAFAVRDQQGRQRYLLMGLRPRFTSRLALDLNSSWMPDAGLVSVAGHSQPRFDCQGKSVTGYELGLQLKQLFTDSGRDFFPDGETPKAEAFPVNIDVERDASYQTVVAALGVIQGQQFCPVFPLVSFI